ncbi:MAG: ATP-binding protein [Pseudoramibacter sp.]
MIIRKEYLDLLNQWKDEKIIKVITGIRRCGKSTLLKEFQDQLMQQGIQESQIISINFEDLAFEELQDYHQLYQYIINQMSSNQVYYIFLDEIQKVSQFEKVVDSLYIKENVDIYITGSNAFLLSGELATLLSGRYIEINMLPFSFREYAQAMNIKNEDQAFTEYMRFGGMPYAVTLGKDQNRVDTYLEGIYNTILIKDIEEREMRKAVNKNGRKINDVSLLKNISRFLAGSVGSPISMKKIAGYITSTGRKVSQTTIADYVKALVEPYIYYEVQPINVSGKQLLKNVSKYYIADLGIRNYILPKQRYDLGFSLENIIYFELKRRGYEVCVGKIGSLEVDFVARKAGAYQYYQVTANLTDQTTFDREIAPLLKIKDNYPKVILTLDRFTEGDYEGIQVMNAVDWLLNQE